MRGEKVEEADLAGSQSEGEQEDTQHFASFVGGRRGRAARVFVTSWMAVQGPGRGTLRGTHPFVKRERQSHVSLRGCVTVQRYVSIVASCTT